MDELIELLLGLGQTPVRREVRLLLTYDEDGVPTVQPLETELISLSPEGSIDRVHLTHAHFMHCGCSAHLQQIGGQCVDCGNISCVVHQGWCFLCRKPLCLECSNLVEHPEQGRVVLCPSCRNEAVRGAFWRQVKRVLLPGQSS